MRINVNELRNFILKLASTIIQNIIRLLESIFELKKKPSYKIYALS
jgi:hypothetical protein